MSKSFLCVQSIKQTFFFQKPINKIIIYNKYKQVKEKKRIWTICHQKSWPKITLKYSLWQKGCQISVKNLIFDDHFYKKGLILITWVLRMIKPSGSITFLMKWGCRGHWGHWGCWGYWGHWGGRSFRAWKTTTEDFRVIKAFEFSFIFMFWKKVFFGRIVKYTIEF